MEEVIAKTIAMIRSSRQYQAYLARRHSDSIRDKYYQSMDYQSKR